MKFNLAGTYAAHSDCGGYCITWGDVAPPYYAHLRGHPPERYELSLGTHGSKAAAKAACVAHEVAK